MSPSTIIRLAFALIAVGGAGCGGRAAGQTDGGAPAAPFCSAAGWCWERPLP